MLPRRSRPHLSPCAVVQVLYGCTDMFRRSPETDIASSAMSRGSLRQHRSSGALAQSFASAPSLKGKDRAIVAPFEPCAATASLFLLAQGSAVICLHHDTLALERKFPNHEQDIQFISVDNVSERGAGRLVVTYDYGQTAIVWDLFTGDQIARFNSYDAIRVASWMRNGNIAFGTSNGLKEDICD